jgi:hypothetical protein
VDKLISLVEIYIFGDLIPKQKADGFLLLIIATLLIRLRFFSLNDVCLRCSLKIYAKSVDDEKCCEKFNWWKIITIK